MFKMMSKMVKTGLFGTFGPDYLKNERANSKSDCRFVFSALELIKNNFQNIIIRIFKRSCYVVLLKQWGNGSRRIPYCCALFVSGCLWLIGWSRLHNQLVPLVTCGVWDHHEQLIWHEASETQYIIPPILSEEVLRCPYSVLRRFFKSLHENIWPLIKWSINQRLSRL